MDGYLSECDIHWCYFIEENENREKNCPGYPLLNSKKCPCSPPPIDVCIEWTCDDVYGISN